MWRRSLGRALRKPYDLTPSCALDAVILAAIARHVGRPCPTRHELVTWTDLPRRLIWQYIDGMCARGLLSVEKMIIRDDKQKITRRKITLNNNRSTGWSNVAPERHRFRAVRTRIGNGTLTRA